MVSLAFTTTRNDHPGRYLHRKMLTKSQARLVEAIEPCPVHSDLFEGIVSTRYIGEGAEKRVYIYTWSSTLVLWKDGQLLLSVASRYGHSHLRIHSLQHPILLIDPASQRQKRSPRISVRKGLTLCQ